MDTTEETKLITTCTCGRSSEIVIRPSHGAPPPAPAESFELDYSSTGILSRITLWKTYTDAGGMERYPAVILVSLPMGEVKGDPESLRDRFYNVVCALDSLSIDQLQEVRALIEEIHQRPPFD